MNKKKEDPEKLTMQDATQIALYWSSTAGLVVTPFTRVGAGVWQPGLKWLWVFFALPLWAVESKSLPVMKLWYAWCAASVFYRLTQDRMQYSHFRGHPWIVHVFVDDFDWACRLEAILVILLGYITEDFGLSRLLMTSGFGLLISHIADGIVDENERIAINDASIEMRYRMGRK